MANIIKRNQGNLPMTTLSGLVDRVFNDSLTRFFDDDYWGSTGLWNRVPVNIRETDKTYEMEVVAPGLKKEDFSVQVTNDMLNISYEHKEENKEDNQAEGYVRSEYRTQSFSRSFSLDDTVDANNISAHYQDGILHVSLPKKEGAQKITKSIKIK